MYDHLLIPTDGSELAQNGVDHGLALAKALGSKVTTVIATDSFPLSGLALGTGWIPSAEEIDAFNAGQKQFADKILSAVKASADRMGIAAETIHVADSRGADAILKLAKSDGCDLIVMSSHGRRGVEKLLLGSQTAEVLAHSTIPVLVVK